MKKVIFIGGTSRSGSTLLDLMLANDDRAMSLGEIASILRPTRKHHFKEIERLKKDEKWNAVLKGGLENLYANLFKIFPEIDVFVDSSKNPFWFRYHMKHKKDTYQIHNILIYKTPYELANSYMKRGKMTHWIGVYQKYHRKYLSVIEDFRSISYKDVIVSDQAFQNLCESIGIRYFKGKKEYWNKEHQNFFGSFIVRGESAKENPKERTRKDLKYDGINDERKSFVDQQLLKYPVLDKIALEIEKKDIENTKAASRNTQISRAIKFSKPYVSLLKMKYAVHNLYRRNFPKNLY